MFSSVTATGVVGAAAEWPTLIDGQVLLVIGLALMFSVAGWVVSRLVRR